MRIRVGLAGWSNPPAKRFERDHDQTHLSYHAAHFSCVEINSSFYRTHQSATYARWRDERLLPCPRCGVQPVGRGRSRHASQDVTVVAVGYSRKTSPLELSLGEGQHVVALARRGEYGVGDGGP
jgi:hypothetical protein